MNNDETRYRDGAIVDGGTDTFEFPDPDADGFGLADDREEQLPEILTDSMQEFLLEAVRRAPILRTLEMGPASASELTEMVDLSRSTIHRATTTLEENDLVEKADDQYELTGLGEVVAKETSLFAKQTCAAVALEPFLNTINTNGIPVEHFVDATITRPQPRQPHASIQRIIELLESSDHLRMLSTVISPLYVNVGYREMMDGTEIEAVFDKEAIKIMLSKYQEKAHETISTGQFDLYAHEGLPFELFVFDDRMGMAAHDENGIAQVLVECDARPAIEWAEDIYVTHRDEATAVVSSDR